MPDPLRLQLRQLSTDVERLRAELATTIARMGQIQAELDVLPHAREKRQQLRQWLAARPSPS